MSFPAVRKPIAARARFNPIAVAIIIAKIFDRVTGTQRSMQRRLSNEFKAIGNQDRESIEQRTMFRTGKRQLRGGVEERPIPIEIRNLEFPRDTGEAH